MEAIKGSFLYEGKTMFTVLTTYPENGSRNVGDQLIELRTKELVAQEKGDDEFFTLFREEALEPHLSTINDSRAVLMPAFPVRDTPMYPATFRLTEDITDIKVPLIPIGANWNVYPGDKLSRESLRYSKETVQFLHHVSENVTMFSCREHYACRVLERHGIDNTFFTGDPAWFHLPSLGKPLHRPKKITKVVFSPPLSPYYLGQAKSIITMITGLFPHADKYCAMHLADSGDSDGGEDGGGVKGENSAAMSEDVAWKNRMIKNLARDEGFTVLEMAGDIDTLNFYEECDLHIGYECHAHLFFFSRRIPSVLIAEDARGVGFNHTIGFGGFTGFVRAQDVQSDIKKSHTSGYCTSVEELILAPPKNALAEEVKEFLLREVETNFLRYLGLNSFIDAVYKERMKPFLKALP